MDLRATTIKEIAEAIVLSKQPHGLGRTIFFIGAGCSVTAGIPTATEIAKWMVKDVAAKFGDAEASEDPSICYKALVSKGRLIDDAADSSSGSHIDWYAAYDRCFERFYRSPDQVRELFATLIDQGQGAINWAHLCLGELVSNRLIGTVLTTNFDQLVLTGMASAGILPVVSDGLESLNRLSPNPLHPQLVEIHGSRHTYRLRNRREDVAFVGEQDAAISAIIGLFAYANTFVAVGYGGREMA